MNKTRSIALGLLAAGTVLVAASRPGIAVGPEPGSEPWISLHKTLRAMQNSVTNVNQVIDHGVRGFTSAEGATWLERCCSYNVSQVTGGASEIRRVLDYLEAQYATASNLDAIRTLQEMRKHIEEVVLLFTNLGNSISTQDAKNRLMAIVHPFNHVRRSAFELEACCPVDPPAVPPPAK